MSSAPDRPLSVPENAVFVEGSGQWQVGSTDGQNQPEGDHRFFRSDGTLALTCHYEHGVLEGPYRRFHPNGEVAREGLYRGGEIDGRVRAFSSSAPGGEALRSCCVPRGAVRLEAEYDKGSCRGETFYNDKGERLLPDGSVYPDKPSHVPEEALLDPFSLRWFAGEFSQDARPSVQRFWSVEGTLVEERASQSGKLHGVVRSFFPTGALREEAHYREGSRSGPYRRVLPEPSVYADPRIREERGTMSSDVGTGLWEFLDARGTVVRTADFGAKPEIDVESSPAFDKAVLPAERLLQIAVDLAKSGRTAEALCALARAGARSKDAEWLNRAMAELRPALSSEQASAVAVEAVEKAAGKLEVLLYALLRGGEPAALFRSIAASCPRATPATLDLVDAAILLAPGWDQCRVTRALILLSMGDVEGARKDAALLGESYTEQRDFLLQYMRILFGKFDFWPARMRFDSNLADLPEEPCQPLSRFREAIQKCATRLQLIRGAIVELLGAEPTWPLPEVSFLLPNGPLPLERRTFRVPLDEEELPPNAKSPEGETFEEVCLDETLDLSRRDIAPLMRLARIDWNVLTWLCWSAGLDRAALPDRIVPPASFSQAVGMAIERQWRAWDKFTTGGLVALTKGVRGFEWEGLDIDFISPVLAELAAHEYTELRAVFFFLCDDRQESPWQDNLRG